MAKAKKARSRPATTRTAKRATTRRSTRTRGRSASARRAGVTAGLFDFAASNWMKDLMGSQTSRVIMAEALVAAAGAAAAVLVASRTETGRQAGKALADGGALMREAALSAAVAARDVIGRGATEAIGSAARSLLGAEETQQDIARKALRLKREHDDDTAQPDMAETARRYRERDRPQ